MPMSLASDHLADWRDNERAFQAAMTEVNALASAAGYVLKQPHNEMEGWPYVLHAEVRPTSSLRLLACLDVALNDHGEMLVQTIPGETRTFHNFRAKDKAFYVRSFRRLVGSALVSDR